jgi:hypothetical protein
MIRAADHSFEWQVVRFASLDESVDDTRSAVGRGIGIDEFHIDADAAVARDIARSQFDFSQDGITPSFVDIANVDCDLRAAGNAVDSARKYIAYADGPYRVRRTAASGVPFNCECDLGCGEKRIVPIRHQHGARMAAFAFNRDFEASRRCDRHDHAEWNIALLKNRSLFNMQFNEGGIMVARQPHRWQRAREPGGGPRLIERGSIAIFELSRGVGIQQAG